MRGLWQWSMIASTLYSSSLLEICFSDKSPYLRGFVSSVSELCFLPLYLLSASLCLCLLHASIIKKHLDTHEHTHTLTNDIINHSRSEPLNPSLSRSVRRMSPLFNDSEGGNGFALFAYNSITVCRGVQYCTELTRPHHLVILTLFCADIRFPLAFI